MPKKAQRLHARNVPRQQCNQLTSSAVGQRLAWRTAARKRADRPTWLDDNSDRKANTDTGGRQGSLRVGMVRPPRPTPAAATVEAPGSVSAPGLASLLAWITSSTLACIACEFGQWCWHLTLWRAFASIVEPLAPWVRRVKEGSHRQSQLQASLSKPAEPSASVWSSVSAVLCIVQYSTVPTRRAPLAAPRLLRLGTPRLKDAKRAAEARQSRYVARSALSGSSDGEGRAI